MNTPQAQEVLNWVKFERPKFNDYTTRLRINGIYPEEAWSLAPDLEGLIEPHFLHLKMDKFRCEFPDIGNLTFYVPSNQTYGSGESEWYANNTNLTQMTKEEITQYLLDFDNGTVFSLNTTVTS